MSTIYLLVKARSGSAYELGSPIFQGFSDLRSAFTGFGSLSNKAMWRIGSDSMNCEVHDFSNRWNTNDLASLIEQAIIHDFEVAQEIAADILKWAGSEPVILVPDNLEYGDVSERLGFPPKRIRIVKSVYRR